MDATTSGMTVPVESSALGRRIFAYFIDLVLGVVLYIAFILSFGTTTTYTTTTTLATGASTTGTGVYFNLTGVQTLFYSLVILAYFVLMEWAVGATLGKLFLGLRVVRVDGSQMSLWSALVRNLLPIVDSFPYVIPNVAGLLFVTTSNRQQRLGDRAANTVVVRR
ncbi:MAG TPA: RDD family protein [Chloroflexota bacterium]|nr:RDD family protein [Chloroflexota bacterium]